MGMVVIKRQGSSSLEEMKISLDSKKNSGIDQLKLENPINGTIYGTLLNYKGEIEILASSLYEAPYKQPPNAPVLYIKPINTYSSYQSTISLPKDASKLQVGAALGIVIGKDITNVEEEDVLDYIFGYTIVNDVSVPHDNYYRPAIKQKCRDGFCPVGPWIVKQNTIQDPNNLTIQVFVNDELKQENNTKNLIRPVQKLISEVSKFMTLFKGDVLLVGVPENPPLVKAGDVIGIEIEGIGYLENTVQLESNVEGAII